MMNTKKLIPASEMPDFQNWIKNKSLTHGSYYEEYNKEKGLQKYMGEK